MAAFRDRRPLWGSLAISLALHGAGFAALALVVAREPRAAAAGGAGGGGVTFVELVAGAGDGPDAADAIGEPGLAARSAASRGSAPARQAATAARAAQVRPEAVAAAIERSAPQRASHAGPGSAAPAPATAGGGVTDPGAGRGHGDAADAGDCPSTLERVARPATEVSPRYPESSRARGAEASVIVDAWVAASGRVERAQVRASGGPDFDAAALAAVREARFHPALRDCAPVASRIAMRLHFALER